LRHVPSDADPRILVDAAARDDAAVFQIGPDRALVATVDFFTPIVDDAYDFGRIAAANAFSDLYAMGAAPLFGLNLVGWPRDRLPLDLLGDVLRGGADIARAAGAFVLGGHSVDDPEPKFGMVVLGDVHPEKLVTNAGARPGDALVLSKPIGTGILTTALKRDLLPAPALGEAVAAMTTLNAGAARAMMAIGVHAATDVTGFGLLGHLHTLLRASGVAAEIRVADVPVFAGTREMLAQGAVPGGTQRNLENLREVVHFADSIPAPERLLLADAQTSGGLLVAVSPERVDRLREAMMREGTPAAAVIGRITPGAAGTVVVR
jgi:selenide,water dikinase